MSVSLNYLNQSQSFKRSRYKDVDQVTDHIYSSLVKVDEARVDRSYGAQAHYCHRFDVHARMLLVVKRMNLRCLDIAKRSRGTPRPG